MPEFVHLEGLRGVVDTLLQLPPELVSKRGGVIRRALRKAAVVIQKQEQENLQRIIDTPNLPKGGQHSTGLLKKNIVVSRGPQPAGQNGETMLVKIRSKTYPGKDGGAVVKTTSVAVLLEQGTSKRQPYPWIRPAFESKKGEALKTFVDETIAGLNRAIKKLKARNRVR